VAEAVQELLMESDPFFPLRGRPEIAPIALKEHFAERLLWVMGGGSAQRAYASAQPQ
jgi:hypothetical protein